jgi:opacity protein-like surface antigen
MTPIGRLLAPALVLGAVLAHTAHAQSTLPVSFELRGGAAFPTDEFSDGASTGWTVDGTVRYAIQPLELYAGYEHASFGVDESQGPESVDGIADDGVRAGLRVNLLMDVMAAVRPWVEAGLIYSRTSVTGSGVGTSATFTPRWGLGFEAGGGLTLDLSPTVSLTPGVRYHQHTTHVDSAGGGEGDLSASYVAVDVGISFRP